MACSLSIGIDGAPALVGDVRAFQRGFTRIDTGINEGDGDALAGVALLACRIQVVVGEILLGRNPIVRVRGGPEPE